MLEVLNSAPAARLAEAVLFPFDDGSVPFTAGLRLQLVPGKAKGEKAPIVLGRGEPGTPDSRVVRFYGTVIDVDGELRMWYLARGDRDPEPGQLRVCYAVSRDGVHWEKPDLGLVEYNGSRENNIVDLLGGRCAVVALPIIRDADDPDPSRRFKVIFESGLYDNRMAVAFSPDGLHWTESSLNPVGPMLEQTGLVRFRGCYYVNGQGGAHFGPGTRKLATFASYDFEHWTQSACLGFRRDTIPPRAMVTEWNAGPEVHLGAGLWDRGNVLIGVYDMWHGHPSGDRAFIGMDIGLVVSNDALHYREPIPDFRLIPAFEESGATPGRAPALSHGQGMLNVGDQTLCWYEIWGGSDVRLVRWPRDRLGYFEVYRASAGPHCISSPMRGDGAPLRVYANVDGVSEHSHLSVEVLDERFYPLPGYSGALCVPLQTPGLRQPVTWRERDRLTGIDGPFRLKVDFRGIRPEDAKLYALYVTGTDSGA